MRMLSNVLVSPRASSLHRFNLSSTAAHGRAAAYRRTDNVIYSFPQYTTSNHIFLCGPIAKPAISSPPRNTIHLNDILRITSASFVKNFHTRTAAFQQAQRRQEAKVEEEEPVQSERGESAKKSERSSEQPHEENAESEKKSSEEDNNKKEDAPPPPPPHGDKTPWQVFMETLNSEFKASKEWNESTKALSSGVNDFTQNETVKKAREAYTQSRDAATSTTSKAFKNTGRAIGQSAAWTWDTSVVRGIRKGVNAAGTGLEKVTRPVRETEAYKNVKNVIDDGSSSKYGGWAEKEERRKRRELRELTELQRTGRSKNEKTEEDPEYVLHVPV